MRKLLNKANLLVGAALLAATGPAFASVDSEDPFVDFMNTVDGYAKGGLGTGLAITMTLIGGIAGVARNSPMPALSGVAGAACLRYGPEVIKKIMGAGALV